MISDRAGKCVSGSCCQLSGRACAIAVSKRVAIFVMKADVAETVDKKELIAYNLM